VPTGILLVIWSVAESITVTESDVGATTNKFCAKAEEKEMQATVSKTPTPSNPRERSGRKGERASGRTLEFCMILIAIISSCASEPYRSRFFLRKEGEVAWLASPNGLGATESVTT
jgi:hypothetical protein